MKVKFGAEWEKQDIPGFKTTLSDKKMPKELNILTRNLKAEIHTLYMMVPAILKILCSVVRTRIWS